ncbi:MBG domain-containing protein [Acidicapsa dinghuensis]|uniref:MBG domain-containing protein n=1 Tax=Acidicapsa dinghuensis TaxID=2218256 RepID=A0ABW1EQM8_9BACT|nr:MBG domain-containing protein [Acidicapsa dinghuensis]
MTGVFLMLSVAAATPAIGQVTFAGSQIVLAAGAWSKPAGIAVDASGDLFVADAVSGAVAELANASGSFAPPETVLSGLSNPSALAFDSMGNLLIADSGNGRILMLPTRSNGFGAITTVASGLGRPAGMGFDAAGNLYFADTENNVVMQASLAAGVYSAPVVVSTGYNAPVGVAFDGQGDLLVADAGNHRVTLQHDNAGTFGSPGSFITSITPTAIWSDKTGDIYIGDSSSSRVLTYTWYSPLSRFTSIASMGSQLSEPAGITVDSKGNMFIADAGAGTVLESVTTAFPFGAIAAGASSSAITYNFAIPAGTTLGQAIVSMKGMQEADFVATGADSCSGRTFPVAFDCGVSVIFHPQGTGMRPGAVEIMDGTGNPATIAFLYGTGIGARFTYAPARVTVLASLLNAPAGVAVDGSGDLFISDTGNNRVLELPSMGSGYGSLTPLPIAGLNAPAGLAIDGAGNLYVASYGNDRVIRLPWLGAQFGTQSTVGTGLYGPSAVATDSQSNVYVAQTLAQTILRIPWSGNKFLAETDVGNYTGEPVGIAVGATGNVLFDSPYHNYVAEVPWLGSGYGYEIYLTRLNTSSPSQMVTDGNSNLYILDTAKNQVIMVPWLGTAYGTPITVANGFNAPQGLAIDNNGALYVADTGNNQVVKIDLSIPGSLTFPTTYVGSTSSGAGQSAIVENTGNASLELESVSFPADFSETSASTCAPGEVLAAAAGCTLAVSFAPAHTGNPLVESLNLSSGDLSSSDASDEASFSLSGVAIPQTSQTISFPAIAGETYGDAPVILTATASSGLAVQYQILSGPGVISHSGNTYSLRFSGAGKILLEATQGGNAQYQAAALVILSVTVNPAVMIVVPANASATYGKIPSSFSYSLTRAVNGDNPLNVTSGKPVLTTTAMGSSSAGSYAIVATQGTLSGANYVFAFTTGTLTIAKAALQVSGVAVSQAYGSALPVFAWTMSGFVNGDTASIVSGAPGLSTTANSGSPVGSYPIAISTGSLSAENYSFVLHNATLTVTAAQLTVTATSASITYGQAIPTLGYTISGYVNGDLANVVSGSPVISTTATQGAVAGSYSIVCAAGTLSAVNYSFHCVNGTLSIQKAMLTVSPNGASMAYGSALPAFGYSFSGFVNGDSFASAVTGVPSFTTTANSHSKPGSYVINASVGSLSAKNYSFSFDSGTLTVTKAVLSVSANNISAAQGSALPPLTYSATGLVNGDTLANATTGAPLLTTNANMAAAGSYPIIITQGTISSANYQFSLTNGVLTVAPPVAPTIAKPTPQQPRIRNTASVAPLVL